MPEAILNGIRYDITNAKEMTKLALAMQAAAVESVPVEVDGELFSTLSLDKAMRSGGLIKILG